ncbi:MAG: response regulator [Chloroflexota bacterium]|nr:response regulator [Chloroflexota bacterium]
MQSDDSPPIRVVLLDDHDVARNRSVERLGQHPLLEIVGDAADCAEALKLAHELQPDAVLVETTRLDKRGLEAIGLLSSLDEELRPAVVAYLEILHRSDWPDARAAGADDVLLKEMRPDAIAKELQTVVDRFHGVRGIRRPRLSTA